MEEKSHGLKRMPGGNKRAFNNVGRIKILPSNESPQSGQTNEKVNKETSIKASSTLHLENIETKQPREKLFKQLRFKSAGGSFDS